MNNLIRELNKKFYNSLCCIEGTVSLNSTASDEKNFFFDNYPSIILYLLSYRRIIENDTDNGTKGQLEHILFDYFQKLVKEINNEKRLSLSLYYGITGTMFVLEFFPEIRLKYKALYDNFNILYNKLLEEKLVVVFKNQKNNIILKEDYDLINGLTSCLNFLITKKQIVQEDEILIQKSLGLLNNEIAIIMSSSDINISLSHGLSGIISVISKAVLLNRHRINYIDSNLVLKVLEKFKSYFKSVNEYNFIGFPGVLTDHKKMVNQIPERMSWCYGTPGILRSLYYAGNAFQDKEIILLVEKAFKDIFEKNVPLRIESPTVCHGYSGLILLLKGMYEDTEDIEFLSFTKLIYDKIICLKKENYDFIFKEFDYVNRGKTYKEKRYFNDLGILNGSTGVMLSLMALLKHGKTPIEEILLT